jgi:transcriptional regulator with XRE-family HTH domain
MTDVGRGGAFRDLLRRHREAAGLSQEALASRSGISADAIGLLERGQRRRPRADTIRRLATALRLDEAEHATLEASVDGPAGAPRGIRRPPLATVAAAAGLVVLAAGLLGGFALVGSRVPGAGPTRTPTVAIPTPSAPLVAQVTPSPADSAGAPAVQPSAGPAGGLPCELPIDRGGSGAFALVTADGVQNGMVEATRLTADPAGSPTLPDGEPALNVTYSWDLARWLPVRPEWVAPDRLHYAFSDRSGRLHVTDAATGADRFVNGDRPWAVIAYQAEGVYAAVTGGSGRAAGLWLVDPVSGRARELEADGAWQGVADGAAWSLDVTTPAVPPSPVPRDGIYGNTVRRLDLRTGQTTTMYSRPDAELHFVGLDAAGNAYVTALSGFAAPLVEIVAPYRTLDLRSDAWVNVHADGDRLWLGGNASTAVYLKDSAGLRPMGTLTSGQVRVAGDCR